MVELPAVVGVDLLHCEKAAKALAAQADADIMQVRCIVTFVAFAPFCVYKCVSSDV